MGLYRSCLQWDYNTVYSADSFYYKLRIIKIILLIIVNMNAPLNESLIEK